MAKKQDKELTRALRRRGLRQQQVARRLDEAIGPNHSHSQPAARIR